ncbi:MAG: AzlD domain-containing protein [Desulfovibrionaceae bacterium]|nr:AzlD domain-containing protein [Desulfovibrionaceae bacterium]
MPHFLLGQVLPPAIFSLLVVSLKNTDFVTGNHGLPELASCLIVVLIHIWKRQMLFSIAGGTAAYMFLVQIIFKV